MARFLQLHKIIREIVEAIGWTITIDLAIDNFPDDTWTLSVKCTGYLNPCTQFTIGADTWEVVSFRFNEELVVKPVGHPNPIAVTSFTLPAPQFFHGVVKRTDEESQRELDDKPHIPAIYLYETLDESVSLVSKAAIERTATPRIFILLSNKFNDMIQLDYDVELFDPLSNVEEKLIDGFLSSTNIGKFTGGYGRINHEQFGWTDRNGHLKRIFSNELSALEIVPELNVTKCGNQDKSC